MSKTSSYSAAGAIPWKIFKNKRLLRDLHRGHIPPVHVQFIPTNRCNLKCSFCSCMGRDSSREMDLDEIQILIPHLKDLGTQSVTITGGGEPLLHKDIATIIEWFYVYGIDVGLVTNGVLLDKLKPNVLSMLTWCRISCADERPFTGRFRDAVAYAVTAAPYVDWAFSYVVSSQPNLDNLFEHIEFANLHDFTHVRVVSDLLDIEHSPIVYVKTAIEDEINTDRVIWQDRQEWTKGKKRCLISLLKPVIGPDGFVYPCCGVQYALEDSELDLPVEMRMGHWASLGKMGWFNGSHCIKCYYDNYNITLSSILDDINHISFV